jgi:hypothetical protein
MGVPRGPEKVFVERSARSGLVACYPFENAKQRQFASQRFFSANKIGHRQRQQFVLINKGNRYKSNFTLISCPCTYGVSYGLISKHLSSL